MSNRNWQLILSPIHCQLSTALLRSPISFMANGTTTRTCRPALDAICWKSSDECGVGMNAVEIEEAVSQLAEAPFDPAAFPCAFLEAFGNKEATLKRLKSGNTNQSDLPGGILQRNNIHI